MTPEEWLRSEFMRCKPWLQAALDRYPLKTHAIEHVWLALESGNAQLWPTPNSACVTEIVNNPTGLKVMHGWLAGGDLSEILQTVGRIEKYAASIGCHATSINGRRGWLRAFDGYREASAIMTKEL